MNIETLRLFDNTYEEGVMPENQTGCEGFAVRVDGECVFQYFNCKNTPEDSNLGNDHEDVTTIGDMLAEAFREGARHGALNGDPNDVEVIDHEPTYDVDEFLRWSRY